MGKNDNETSISGEKELTYCQYCAQAVRNERFLVQIEEQSPTDFSEWKVTVVFYTAVHYLKSLARLQGIRLKNHQDTFDKLYSKPPELNIGKPARSAYHTLFKLAHTSRYNGYRDDATSRKADKIRLKDAKRYLEIIKEVVVPKLETGNIQMELA